MTEEEFRALGQLHGAPSIGVSGAAPVPKPSSLPKPFQRAPRPPQQGYGNSKKPGGSFGVKLPLVVRQSQTDGSFSLAFKMNGSIKIDQETFAHICTNGEGLDGRDANGQYVEGWKAGELTVWPPFSKK